MITLDLTAYGVKVVRSDQMGVLYSGTWRIVAMFQEDVTEWPNSGYTQANAPVTLKKTFFLIAQTNEEEVLKELRAALDAQTRNAQHANDRQREFEGKLKAAEADVTRLAEERTRQLTIANRCADETRAAVAAKRKLEVDLAKVRTALGELRWKEILDSKEG